MNIKTLRVSVENKIATYRNRDGVIVCGNKGYAIAFSFDEEWDEYTTKTARFIWNGKYYDQEFNGNECPVPVLNATTSVTIGVYAGDLKTTTPAEIPCLISILCGKLEATDERVKEYRDIAQQAAEEAKQAAAVVVHPTIDVEKIEGGHRLTINDVEGEKNFDIMDGENGGKNGVGISKIEKTSTNGLVDTYTITLTNGDTYTFTITNGKDAEGSGLTDDQNELLNNLKTWYEKNHHTDMKGTFSSTVASKTVDIGSTITSTFKWSFDKKLDTLTVGGVTYEPPVQSGEVTETFTLNSQGSLSFTIYGTHKGPYKTETASQTWNYTFQNKVYYGALPKPTDKNGNPTDVVDSTFIKNLAKSVSSGGGGGKGTYATDYENAGFNLNDKSGDKYIWYVYPSRFENQNGKTVEPKFTAGGFEGGFDKLGNVPFTNDSKFTEYYCVWRSTNPGVGAKTIIVE